MFPARALLHVIGLEVYIDSVIFSERPVLKCPHSEAEIGMLLLHDSIKIKVLRHILRSLVY